MNGAPLERELRTAEGGFRSPVELLQTLADRFAAMPDGIGKTALALKLLELLTGRDHYGNRGRSWRRETDQVFEELDYILDRARAVAQEHGLPIETVMASFGLASGKPAPSSDRNNPADNVPSSGDERHSDDAGGAGPDA